MLCLMFFFFNDTATTEIYTLSLHDALPISGDLGDPLLGVAHHLGDLADRIPKRHPLDHKQVSAQYRIRSEEHTSELQSRQYLVCRLLLEKKKKKKNKHI